MMLCLSIATLRRDRESVLTRMGIPPANWHVFHAVVILDLWAVNRSEDFRAFVKENYPWMRVRYIPA